MKGEVRHDLIGMGQGGDGLKRLPAEGDGTNAVHLLHIAARFGAAGGMGEEIAQLVEIATGRFVGRLLSHQPRERVGALAFSPDGHTLVTASTDNTCRRWSVPDGEPIGRPLVHPTPVFAAAFSADGRYVATAQRGGQVRIWRVPTSSPGSFRVPLDGSASLTKLSRDGRFLLPTGLTYHGYGLRSTRVVALAHDQPDGPVLGKGGLIRDGAFSPDGHQVALARERPDKITPARPGQVELWDWRTGKLLHDPVPLPSEPRGLDYSPDGRFLAVTCSSGELLLLDPAGGRVVRQWSTHRGRIPNVWYINNGSVRFSPDGQSLLTWTANPFVRVWDPETGRERIPGLRHPNLVDEIAFSPDGAVLATAGRDDIVRFWNLATGKSAGEPLAHPEWVFAVQFSPDGRLLLTTCRDGAARLWDWRERRLVCPPLKHDNEVHPATFLRGGRWVVTASLDRTSRVWEVRTGLPATPALPLTGQGLGIVVSPDSKFAVAGGLVAALEVIPLNDLDVAGGPGPDDLCLWGELVAGRRILTGGGVANLTAAEWFERWQAFRVRSQPDNVQFRIAHAKAYLALEQSEHALAEATKAIELQPEEPGSWETRATIYLGLKKWNEALVDYSRASDLKPGDPNLLGIRADLLAFLTRWDEAARDFARLATMRDRGPNWPWYPRSRHILALRAAGKTEDYRKACARLLEDFKDTTDPQTALTTAWVCALSPDVLPEFAMALRLAEKGAPQQAQNPQAHVALGAILYRMGRLEESLKRLDIAESSDNSRATTSAAYWYYFRAMAYYRLRHEKQAHQCLEKAVSITEKELQGEVLSATPTWWVRAATLRLLRAETEEMLKAPATRTENRYTKAGELDAALAIRGRIRQIEEKAEQIGEVCRFEGHEAAVVAVAFSPDGRIALSACSDDGNHRAIRLWDLKTGKEIRRLDGHTGRVWGVAFSPDGKRILSCSQDKTVRMWNAETGEEVKRLEGHDEGVLAVVFSPDGKRALSTGWDKTVRLWDVESGKELKRLEGHTDTVRRVAFSPDGRQALSGSFDQSVRLWDLETSQVLKTLEGHTGFVHGVAFTPDGRRAVSCAFDKSIRLWNLESGKQIKEIQGPQEIHELALSPDGRRLLTAAWDQTVRLWDVESGRELQCFFWHTAKVNATAFSPDGRYALSGGDDRTMRLWRLPDTTGVNRAAEGRADFR